MIIDFAEPLVRAAVIGGGSWGTAFARLLALAGHDTVLVCRDPEQAVAIARTTATRATCSTSSCPRRWPPRR